MELTQFDFIAGPLLLVSAIIGFTRGATRELMTVLAFLLAAILAIICLRFTAPLGRAMIDPDWAGVGIALLFVFGLAYIALRLLGATLERQVRALVLLGGFSLLFNMATPPESAPRWVTSGVFYPLADASGRILKAFAPDGFEVARTVAPRVEKAVRDGVMAPKAGEKGYEADERGAVDDLVEKTR
jgi:membrane protein required for colicin V production